MLIRPSRRFVHRSRYRGTHRARSLFAHDVVAPAALGLAAVLVATAGIAAVLDRHDSPPPVSTGSLGRSIVGFSAAAPARPSSDEDPPITLRIPAIGVHASDLVGLRVDGDGILQAPTSFTSVGWYRDGVAPGDRGPAVLVGHIDSYRGPAVFARLASLRPHDVIKIQRADGSQVTFVVDALREFSKLNFPTRLVYGNTAGPTLRLITCGGQFDQATGHYYDNVIAFAHLKGHPAQQPSAHHHNRPAHPPHPKAKVHAQHHQRSARAHHRHHGARGNHA